MAIFNSYEEETGQGWGMNPCWYILRPTWLPYLEYKILVLAFVRVAVLLDGCMLCSHSKPVFTSLASESPPGCVCKWLCMLFRSLPVRSWCLHVSQLLLCYRSPLKPWGPSSTYICIHEQVRNTSMGWHYLTFKAAHQRFHELGFPEVSQYQLKRHKHWVWEHCQHQY